MAQATTEPQTGTSTSDMQRKGCVVCAVVVTHNRLDLLKQCLAALRAQTHPADVTVVVDNGSTDETAAWLAGQNDLVVIRQPNSGSAGGQNTGIREAWRRGADWIWCMDDDTLPATDSLQAMIRHPVARRKDIGFLCSWVLWKDGTLHRMNPPRLHPRGMLLQGCFDQNVVPVASCSFVSVLVHRRAVEACGLPQKEMFIWYDDVEYTLRISNRLSCYAVGDSRVVHATEQNCNVEDAPLTGSHLVKICCAIRNRIFVRVRHRGGFLAIFREARLRLADVVRVWRSPMGAAAGLKAAAAWFDGLFRFRPPIEMPVPAAHGHQLP